MAMRRDPVLGYNFEISLLPASSSLGRAVTTVVLSTVLDSPIAGFSKCTGLEMTLELEAYKEGGNNGTTLQFPTRVTWNKLTLERGLTYDTQLWEWFSSFVEGRGERRDGVITLRDASGQPHTVWRFRRGLPARYAGPQLEAERSNVAVETVEIAHEGLHQVAGTGVLSQAVGAVVDLFR
jgi:phage tail-like protein